MLAQVNGERLRGHHIHVAALLFDKVGGEHCVASGASRRWHISRQPWRVLVQVERVKVGKAGLEKEVAPNGLLALVLVKPISLPKPAIKAAAVARDRRVDCPASMPRCHVAASRERHVALRTDCRS
eukprot:6197490-Pleurochrysis_carterae.AAC.1